MRNKIILLLTTLALFVSSSVTVFAESIENKFLAANYNTNDDWEVGYSYVDSGYGYFEYIYTDSEYYDEAITIIANDLSLTGEVTEEELEAVLAGEITDEMVAEWFVVDPSEFSKETINGQEYRVVELELSEQERVYFITYHGTVEYQFCMPAASIADAGLIRDFLETVTFTGADSMVPIKAESVDLYFDEIGAGLELPDFAIYYYRGIDPNHPNWIRSYEDYDELMEWMDETNTYVYMLSDDVYDEVHLYTVDSYNNKNLSTASSKDVENIRDNMKASFESQGHTIDFIDGGIVETSNATFIALQIEDAGGYDTKYYYTSDGKTGYVLECFYYEDQIDEEFIDIFTAVVGTFYMDSVSGGGAAGGSTPSGTGASGDTSSATGMITKIVPIAVIAVVAIIAVVVMSSKKKKKEDDFFSSNGGSDFNNGVASDGFATSNTTGVDSSAFAEEATETEAAPAPADDNNSGSFID